MEATTENENPAGFKRRTNFTIVSDDILDNSAVGKMELLVFLALCRFTNKEGICYPSLQTIAKKARCDRRSVIRSIAKLEELGYILKQKNYDNEKRKYSSNVYEIVDNPRGGSDSQSPPWWPGVTRGSDTEDTIRDIHLEGISREGEKADEATEPARESKPDTSPTLFTCEDAEKIYNEANPNGYRFKASQEDIMKLRDYSRKYGSERIRSWFSAYCLERPGKDLKYFWEYADTKRETLPERYYTCPRCGRIVREGRACYACEYDPAGTDEQEPYEPDIFPIKGEISA